MSKRGRTQSRAQRRLEEVRRQQQARQRRQRLLIAVPLAVVLIAAAAVATALLLSAGPKAANDGRASASPFLATLSSMAQGRTVDGIACDTSEQTAYHIHAHLAVFVNGTQRMIPAEIGIPGGISTGSGSCLYWMHTHDQAGVIHIESPAPKLYTLGDFFDIWGQPLTANQAGPATGTLTAYVNGHLYHGDPRAIVLRPHTVIQLDIGKTVPPRPYTFPAGL